MGEEIKMLKIRKLTPCECLKLMGFDEEDYKAMKSAELSDSQVKSVEHSLNAAK